MSYSVIDGLVICSYLCFYCFLYVCVHVYVRGAVWLSGNIVGRINEVTLRQAGLVLRWVTVHGYTVLVSNQATQAHSAWPSIRE